jgi:microcystin-dependent protein
MSGFWHLSHHQMRDPNGAVYAGAKAYFYEADGLTRLIVYQDYGLTSEHPNPIEANAYGVFPPVFLDEDDEFYRQRITTSGGVVVPGTDVGVLPIVGPTGGGGGGGDPVDTTTILTTGDIKARYQTGTLSGYVRANGRSIGSATSGATERANSDCEALFEHLWNNDTNLAVSGGRGVSAAADWAANKAIILPDFRGRVLGGLGDMGAVDAARLTAANFGTSPIVLGAAGGSESHTLTTAQLPVVTPAGAVSAPTFKFTTNSADWAAGGAATVTSIAQAVGGTTVETTTPAFTGTPFGSGNAHPNVQPTMLITIYIKL